MTGDWFNRCIGVDAARLNRITDFFCSLFLQKALDNRSHCPKTKIIKWITRNSENQNKMSLNVDPHSSEMWTLITWRKLENNRRLCSHVARHYRFMFKHSLFGGRATPKLLSLSKTGRLVIIEEVRAECEQREKMNTGGAIHVACAWNIEMKLTRHLSIHMAERRENHPVTLHSRAKCQKKPTIVLLLKNCTDTRLEATNSRQGCLCLTPNMDLLTSIYLKSCLAPTLSPPPFQIGLQRRWPDWDGCDVEALGLCSRARYPPILPRLFIKPQVQK